MSERSSLSSPARKSPRAFGTTAATEGIKWELPRLIVLLWSLPSMYEDLLYNRSSGLILYFHSNGCVLGPSLLSHLQQLSSLVTCCVCLLFVVFKNDSCYRISWIWFV